VPKIIGGSLRGHRTATRERVFEALASLMADRPFDAITMADLAATAGVGRSALYNHFADKESVLVAWACEETDRYVARLRDALAAAATPSERLATYVAHHLGMSRQFHLGVSPELHTLLSTDAARALREHVVAVEEVLRQVLDEGVRAGEFALPDVDAGVPLIHAALGARKPLGRHRHEVRTGGGVGRGCRGSRAPVPSITIWGSASTTWSVPSWPVQVTRALRGTTGGAVGVGEGGADLPRYAR
jgi:AcrR family transcriptional regulator